MVVDILKMAAELSDHKKRVNEIAPAIHDSLTGNQTRNPALEIGNREGGSALLIMYYLSIESKHRGLTTVDVHAAPKVLETEALRMGIYWKHFEMQQSNFVRMLQGSAYEKFAFIYLDADHNENNVKADMEILQHHMDPGSIMAVDDVEKWSSLPEMDTMKRVIYDIDQGDQLGTLGTHIGFWKKI